MSGASPDSLTREMLIYLSAHPAAQDTAEGIAEWWLRQHRTRVRIAALRQALAELATRRAIIECRGPDGRLRYRARRRRPRLTPLRRGRSSTNKP